MDSSFTTIKITRSLKRRLHSYKSNLMRARKQRVSDAEAIDSLLESATKATSPSSSSHPRVWAFAGFIKGGAPFRADEEIDRLVYGVPGKKAHAVR